MGENDVISLSAQPWSSADVESMSRLLGIGEGDTVIVHTKMSSMGWVCGGAQAVIEGLVAAVGESGTLVLPAHSGGNSDPSFWSNPPVPEAWWDRIRETMPAFDPRKTPIRGVGSVPELFRTWPGALRSNHPTASFAALGKQALFITSGHESLMAFGEDSSLARVYELDGKVLLIGVGHDNNTSMHLGEFRSGTCKTMVQGAAIMKDGRRQWVSFDEIDMDSDRFPAIGAAFEEAGGIVSRGKICQADCLLFRQRAIVDFTASFLRAMKE